MRKDLYKVKFWYKDKTSEAIWIVANNMREALYLAKQYLGNQEYVSYEVKRES